MAVMKLAFISSLLSLVNLPDLCISVESISVKGDASSRLIPILAFSRITRRQSSSSSAEWAVGIKMNTNDIIRKCNRTFFLFCA